VRGLPTLIFWAAALVGCADLRERLAGPDYDKIADDVAKSCDAAGYKRGTDGWLNCAVTRYQMVVPPQ
jgi:hypothetical protein